MKRVLIAGVAGAIVYYVWQMLTWIVLPIHGPTILSMPNEAPIREALIAQDLETGLYSVPYGSDEEMMDPDSEFTKRHKEGPLFVVFYQKEGMEPMPMSMLGIGILTDFLGATIAAAMLCCAVGGCCCRTYWQRVAFISGFGVFLALMSHVAYMNWMRFPAHYSAMMILDAIVGWFLAGLAIAAIIKPTANGDCVMPDPPARSEG